MTWADSYYQRHGQWPNRNSGAISESPGESWSNALANAVTLNGAINSGSGTTTITANTSAGSSGVTQNSGGSITTTSAMRGIFKENALTRGELLSLVYGGR